MFVFICTVAYLTFSDSVFTVFENGGQVQPELTLSAAAPVDIDVRIDSRNEDLAGKLGDMCIYQ